MSEANCAEPTGSALYATLKVGDRVPIRLRQDWRLLVVTVTDRYRKPGAHGDTVLCETSPGHKIRLFQHHVEWGKQNG